MIFKKFFAVSAFFICIANLLAAEHEIDAKKLKAQKYPGSPQKAFALNGKNIQIKTPNSSITAFWAAHKIQPSANFITFKAKSLHNKNISFKTHVLMHATHASDNDKCNGSAGDKFFIFKDYVQSAEKEFHLPLTVNASDLRCQQCRRIVDHAVFFFYFETENDGGIEITPFTLRVSFNVFFDYAKDKESYFITNVVSPGFKPYEMKKLPTVSRFSDNILVMSQRANPMKAQYKIFLPILEAYQKKDYKNAVLQAEKIANNNTFCSIFLYLLYSRGYGNFQIDYEKAAKYLNNFIGSTVGREPGFRFYFDEYNKIWKKYRLIPTRPAEKATVKAWGRNYATMDEVIPLRGKYPLKNCYEEQMRNIGGIGARTLYLIGREQDALSDIREHARKLGNAEALTNDYARYIKHRKSLAEEVINKPSDFEFKNLKKAAELGFIPAKLKLARVLVTKNFAPGGFDFATARKLLKESIIELEKYSKTPCTHAQEDLQYARSFLTLIPPPDTPTDELIKKYDAIQGEKDSRNNLYFYNFKLNILAEMISERNDTPDSLYMQALKLPNSQYKKKNEMIRTAAKKGSVKAIALCVNQIVSQDDNEYWYFLYLAGKHKLPYNRSYQNYFNEAYYNLEQKRFMMPPPEYKKALSYLAPYHKRANDEYKILSKELSFDITVSPANSAEAKYINYGGRHMISVKATPSDKARYITVKNKSAEKLKVLLSLFTQSPQHSNLDISCEFPDEQKRTLKIYPGDFTPMKYLPDEFKIYLAPRTAPLDLRVDIMILR